MTTSTFDVRVWKTRTYTGVKGTTYTVRWTVAGQLFAETFKHAAQADSYRSKLLSAARSGEAFDTSTGQPTSWQRASNEVNWYTFACAYVDMKWRAAAATYRRSIAEALVSATMQMFTTNRGKPDEKVIRSALLRWAYNTTRRTGTDMPDKVADTLRWVERNTLPVSALSQPQTLRRVLDGLTVRLDGAQAAATVVNRKRAVLFNAIEYAVERGYLQANPVHSVKWKAPKVAHTVDRRSVVNPVQARSLLNAVRAQKRSGGMLTAFFAVMYFAALRPEEAVNLRARNLVLPAAGWGQLHVERAAPDAGKDWTDTGHQRDERQLKHRAAGEMRPVPCPPELVAILREHLARHGTDDAGRLFRGEQGGELATITYTRVWDRARRATFTPEVYASPLAARPYDLRHAAVSTWLNGGVAPAQVAEWAGHSVDVLLKVYAKCLDGQDTVARQRVENALRGTGSV